MAITATTTTASTIRITIGFLLRAGPRGARRAARLNVVERALVAGLGGAGNGRPMTPDRRTGRAPRPALDEHGIAELVRAVPTGLQLPVGPAERGLVRERAQQFVMAAAGFVRAREDGVDDRAAGWSGRCARSPRPRPRAPRRRAPLPVPARARPSCRPQRCVHPARASGGWRRRWPRECDRARRAAGGGRARRHRWTRCPPRA